MIDPGVVVGGEQVAVQLCLALRKDKYNGPIIVFSEESQAPYHRPPLSKAYITGKVDSTTLPMRPDSFYLAKDIELRLNEKVTAINPADKTISTQTGVQRYSNLVLATGALARPFSIDGSALDNVFQLRDMHDARCIKACLEKSRSIAVIGAGFIGLEAAAAINQLGKKVTVFDTADRVMGRAVAPLISHWFEKTHRSAGIDIHLNESINRVVEDNNGKVAGVERADGSVVTAQMVLVGIGVLPASDLAAAAGIDCDNGVVVDEYCRSSDANVFAAGDCANHSNKYAPGRRIRLESIQNATDQARVVARAIAQPENAAPYQAVPWFWSDQADHSLQMTGLSFDADNHVLRGDPDSGSFSVFHYKGEKLLSVDSVNSSRDHMVARKLLAAGVSPSVTQAADPDVNLMELARSAR